MLKLSLCDYTDAYVLVSGTIAVEDTSAAGAAVNNTNRKVIFKNCDPFTDCISAINSTQVDNAQDIDVVMSMYSLIEHSDNYLKTSGSLWQYYRDESSLDNNDYVSDFTGANYDSKSFKFKQKIAIQTDNDGEKIVKIVVPLKYLHNFWRTIFR